MARSKTRTQGKTAVLYGGLTMAVEGKGYERYFYMYVPEGNSDWVLIGGLAEEQGVNVEDIVLAALQLGLATLGTTKAAPATAAIKEGEGRA